MKKQFLTLALLATVAVGGAFASNAKFLSQGSPRNDSGSCSTPVNTQQPNCDPNNTGAQCTIVVSGSTVPAYIQDEDGKCTQPIFRLN